MPGTRTETLVERIATLPYARGDLRSRKGRAWRRAGIAVLWIVVLGGLTGWLGPRLATTTASADGWTIEVDAPRITRGALDSPVEITVIRDKGFGKHVTVQVDRELVEHLDVNLIAPAPSAETGTADVVEWTFDAPKGRELVVTFDARLAPSEMPGLRTLRFAVVRDGREAVAVETSLLALP